MPPGKLRWGLFPPLAGEAALLFTATMLINRMKAMAGYMVRRVHQTSTALFSEELAPFDLTAVQLVALIAIEENADLDATRLAEMISLDRATTGDVIARLERKGLIARSRGTQDRRTKTLASTPAAARLIAACFDRVETVQQRLLAPLSADEQRQFLLLVAKLAADNEAGPGPGKHD